MKTSQQHKYIVDGKPVFGFLFGRDIRLADGRVTPFFYQVEGFSRDHAYKRLCENLPNIPSDKIYWVDDLDPEHDVGYLGQKLPLFPYGTVGTMTRQ